MRGIIFLTAAVIIGTGAEAQEIDWKKIDDALGRSAAVTGDVHRYGFPRTDLSVTLEGVAIKPALALGGWTAFKPVHGGAMMMGDLVLLETEITPVLTAAIENGLEITAIHNHVLRANPPTFYMHVSGHGDPVKLANALHTTLAASKTPMTVQSAAAPDVSLDTAELDRIVGVKGKPVGGVYQFGIPRRDPITQNKMSLDPAAPLGMATGVNFQPRQWQSCSNRGFRSSPNRSQSSDPRLTCEWHRSHSATQPHARRAATLVLHALLGERRCGQARQGCTSRS